MSIYRDSSLQISILAFAPSLWFYQFNARKLMQWKVIVVGASFQILVGFKIISCFLQSVFPNIDVTCM